MMNRIWKSAFLATISLFVLSAPIFAHTPDFVPEAGVISSASYVATISAQMAKLDQSTPYLVRVFTSYSQGFAEGSGFVFEDENKRCGILTNSHVLGPSLRTTVWVLFEGQKSAQELRIIARDRFLDLALLKCPSVLPEGVKPAQLGTREDIFVGNIVYAVGYPHGDRSVTYGVINSEDSPFLLFAFTNQAPVHPGNSGGPEIIFNKEGNQVIAGMNTKMALQGLQTHTMSVHYIKQLLPRLWEGGEIIHASLGVTITDIQDINPEQYKYVTNKPYPPTLQNGVVVITVKNGSPAGVSGIESGDVIVGLSHQGETIPFEDTNDFLAAIYLQLHPWDKVVFQTIRDSEEIERTVTLLEQLIQ